MRTAVDRSLLYHVHNVFLISDRIQARPMSSCCVLELDHITCSKFFWGQLSIVLANAIKLGLVNICNLYAITNNSGINTLFTGFPLSAGNYHDAVKDAKRARAFHYCYRGVVTFQKSPMQAIVTGK